MWNQTQASLQPEDEILKTALAKPIVRKQYNATTISANRKVANKTK